MAIRYLETSRKTLVDLRKVWGLDAPQQIPVTDGDALGAMSEAELVERIGEHTRAARIRKAHWSKPGPCYGGRRR